MRITKLAPEKIHEICIKRSPTSNTLFNIVGINDKGSTLVTMKADLTYDDAIEALPYEITKFIGVNDAK